MLIDPYESADIEHIATVISITHIINDEMINLKKTVKAVVFVNNILLFVYYKKKNIKSH